MTNSSSLSDGATDKAAREPTFRVGNIVRSCFGPNVFWRITKVERMRPDWGDGHIYTCIRFADSEGVLYKKPARTSTHRDTSLTLAQDYLNEEIEKLENRKLAMSRLSNAIYETENNVNVRSA